MGRKPAEGRTCKVCGNEFTWEQSRGEHYCSRECYGKAQRKGIPRTCKQCGKVFTALQCYVDMGKAIFCSRECVQKSPKKPKTMVVCKGCGKTFPNTEGKRGRVYCSQSCYHASKPAKPKKAKEGRPYQHEKWMLAVLRRDKKCVLCGTLSNLQAHHIKPWKSNQKLRDSVANGVTLCAMCHHTQHSYLPLERFIANGGKSIRYCIVCEKVFVVRKKSQRTCSWQCGGRLNSQQAASITRRPA